MDYLPAELPGKPRDYRMTKTTTTKKNSKQKALKRKKERNKMDSSQLKKEVRGQTLMHLVIKVASP